MPEIGRVIMSERLGAIGPIERRITELPGVELESAALWTEDDIVVNAAEADILIAGASEPLNAAVLGKLGRLRCIVRRGVGVDNVDVPAATSLGIGVAFIPDASVQEVSDHALALLLATERRLFAVRDAVRDGDVAGAGEAPAKARRFGDLALGIVGLGRIGRALAAKASSVFGEVVAFDPYATATGDVALVSLPELLSRADLLSLHTPGGETLLDQTAFDSMKPGVVIVNTARGSLIDEAALLRAIDQGIVAGAALDVTREEPVPADSALRSEPRIVLSGHTAAKGSRSGSSLREGVVEATIRLLQGDLPAYLADPDVVDSASSRLPWRREDRA